MALARLAAWADLRLDVMSNFFIIGYYVSMQNINVDRLRTASCTKSTITQTFLGGYHFFTGREASVCGGTRIFWGGQMGGCNE